MLTNADKRRLENELEHMISTNPQGINTRTLITGTYNNLKGSISYLNRHHVAGMLAWVYKIYGHTFTLRTPGCSVIV